MIYGKLINETLERAPKMLDIEDNHVYNPTAQMYEDAGYKRVIYTQPQEPPTGYFYVAHWEEKENEITQEWTLVKEPDDINDSEALNIILGGAE